MVQWGEHSPPTNVARVGFREMTLYMGWVWCWFLSHTPRVLPVSSLHARKVLLSIVEGGEGGGGGREEYFLPHVSDKHRSLSCIWLVKKKFLIQWLSHKRRWGAYHVRKPPGWNIFGINTKWGEIKRSNKNASLWPEAHNFRSTANGMMRVIWFSNWNCRVFHVNGKHPWPLSSGKEANRRRSSNVYTENAISRTIWKRFTVLFLDNEMHLQNLSHLKVSTFFPF